MNKNTKNANAKNIFAISLTVVLFAVLSTACDDLESSKEKPSSETNTPPELGLPSSGNTAPNENPSSETNTPPKSYAGTYSISELKSSDNEDYPIRFTDISVRDTTAKFTIMSDDDDGDENEGENENEEEEETSYDLTLPIENGIAKEVTSIPIIINFTDMPVYYRMRIVHDGMGDDRENYTLTIVTNTDKSALDDATYPAAEEYTALQTLEKNKMTILLPDQEDNDDDTGALIRDDNDRPRLKIIVGTITKK